MKDTVEKPSEKIDDNNMAHFNRYTKERATRDAQHIYRSVFAGDMATLGRSGSKAEGYPFGSVTPFILDHTGNPVIFTANVAEHTKNAKADSKASLLLRQVERQHQIETGWRLTCVGDLKAIHDDELSRVQAAYLRHYPEAKEYTEVHDFYFFRLNLVAARVIMGFGKISWVEAKDLAVASTLSHKDEERIITHMNDDHGDALKHYLKNLGVTVKAKEHAPRMVSVSQFGAVLDYHHHLYFVEFDKPADNVGAVREQLVALAKTG